MCFRGCTNMNEKMQVARLSILSNTSLVVFKLAAGLAIGSVSVISEAIHSGLDLVAAVIAYFSVRHSGKPPDETHRYGHGKIENISGTIEAMLITVAAIWIIVEAAHKLTAGSEVETVGPGVAVMGISALVNLFVSRKLMRVARATDSIALEADALHLTTDVFTSLGVFLGLIGIGLTGLHWLDPVVAIAVALFILKAAYDLTRQAVLPLIDSTLPPDEEEEIIGIIQQFANEYVEFHKLRTRKAGGERHIDLHLVVPKGRCLEEVHELCDHIERAIIERYPLAHTLIHIEPCPQGCELCPQNGGPFC